MKGPFAGSIVLLLLSTPLPAFAGASLAVGCPATAADIQTALDVVGAAGGGRVTLSACQYTAHNLRVWSHTEFVGQGLSTVIWAPAGATGFVIGLKDPDVERSLIADLWIQGNKDNATVSGVVIDNDGGDWTGADPEIRLRDLLITNLAEDGVLLKASRSASMTGVRVRNTGRDCFSFLSGVLPSATFPGAVDSTTDGRFVNNSGEAAGRNILNIETGANLFSVFKGGQADANALYCAGGCWNNIFSAFALDGTTPVTYNIEGSRNRFRDCASQDGGAVAWKLSSAAADNEISGLVWNPGSLPSTVNALELAPGAVRNSVDLVTHGLLGEPLAAGSDTTANTVKIDGCDFSTPIVVQDFMAVSGTPIKSFTGGRLPMWRLGTNGDQIAASFEVPPSCRGRRVRLEILYNTNLAAAGSIEWVVGLAGLAPLSPVTEVDVAIPSHVDTAPGFASLVYTSIFGGSSELLTLGPADVEGTVTIQRGAGTVSGINVVVHRAVLRVVG